VRAVIVVGAARSGTTWVCNELHRRFALFTPFHPLHYGSKEPNLYGLDKVFQSAGAEGFLARFQHSDNAALLGVDDRLREISHSASDFMTVFVRLMEEAARRAGRSGWVSKVCQEVIWDPARLARFCAALLNDGHSALFVVVERQRLSVLESFLGMPGRRQRHREGRLGGATATMMGVWRHALLYDCARSLLPGAEWVRFEDLREDVDAWGSLGMRLGIAANGPSDTPDPAVRRNATISRRGVSPALVLAADALYRLGVGQAIVRAYSRRRTEPLLYRRLALHQSDPEALIRQLRAEGHLDLADSITNGR
jgi:hypothetical protein